MIIFDDKTSQFTMRTDYIIALLLELIKISQSHCNSMHKFINNLPTKYAEMITNLSIVLLCYIRHVVVKMINNKSSVYLLKYQISLEILDFTVVLDPMYHNVG